MPYGGLASRPSDSASAAGLTTSSMRNACSSASRSSRRATASASSTRSLTGIVTSNESVSPPKYGTTSAIARSTFSVTHSRVSASSTSPGAVSGVSPIPSGKSSSNENPPDSSASRMTSGIPTSYTKSIVPASSRTPL